MVWGVVLVGAAHAAAVSRERAGKKQNMLVVVLVH